jgi:hypothetical protein
MIAAAIIHVANDNLSVLRQIGGLRLTGVSALYVESRQSTYHSKQFSVAARENQRHNMST